MSVKKLTEPAQKILEAYLNLSTKGHKIPCPYYNNKHNKVRGALRVHIGKGSPTEIVQEAHMIALKKKVDLEKLEQDGVKKFLVDHNLGVDCSAFVYYVLNAELVSKKKRKLTRVLKFPKTLNPVRKLIRKFRTAENTNVLVLADNKNSKPIKMKDVQAGDMIIMIGTGIDHARNHVLLVHEVNDEKIKYTHSLQWRTDGKYEHGVRQGVILIVDKNKPLVAQVWAENNITGSTNETFLRARRAETLEIRRLRTL